MKNIIIIAFAFFAFNLSAQTETVQTEEVQKELTTTKIKTSAECGMCKKRIEKNLKKVEGISYSKLHVPTKILKVKFDASIISEEDIRNIVASIGYDADDVPANTESHDKLPACCQKGGMDRE